MKTIKQFAAEHNISFLTIRHRATQRGVRPSQYVTGAHEFLYDETDLADLLVKHRTGRKPPYKKDRQYAPHN